MKLVKILSEWKPEGGFHGLAAVLPSFGLALAVFAASVMVPAGCNNLAGSGPGDETVFTEVSGTAPESAGGPAFAAADDIKTIKVKFEVKNGGWGLLYSRGVVSTQYDRHLAWGFNVAANDFEVRIIVPAGEKHLNIRWEARDILQKCTYLKAGLQIGDGGTYNIVLDYNGRGKVATKNLSDVSLNTKDVNNDFSSALKYAGTTAPEGFRRIKVKFEVLNGGQGMGRSHGIVSTQDDSYLVYDDDIYANDFDITILVPLKDEYLNIRWEATDLGYHYTYVKAKMKAESGTITFDYNGQNNVATKNLYDVRVAPDLDNGNITDLLLDWTKAEERAVKEDDSITDIFS